MPCWVRPMVHLAQCPVSNASHRGGCAGTTGELATFCCPFPSQTKLQPSRGQPGQKDKPCPTAFARGRAGWLQQHLNGNPYCLTGGWGEGSNIYCLNCCSHCRYCQEWIILLHLDSSVYCPLKEKGQRSVLPVGFCPVPPLLHPSPLFLRSI